MGVEISRWMIALGSVAAAVGLVVVGMGTSYVYPRANLINLGLVLMIGGLAVFAVGWLVNRATDSADQSSH